MEMDNKYDEVLVKYLLNETNAADEQFVKKWLSAGEDNRLHLQRLADTFKLIGITNEIRKIDINREWQHFRQVKEEAEQPMAAHGNANNESEIFTVYKPAGRSKVYRLLVAAAVAASIIVAVLFGLGKFSGNNSIDKNEIAKNEEAAVDKKETVLNEVILHKVNTSGKVETFSLPDGTVLTLYTNSEFIYSQPDSGRRREVLLTGKANFKVAKDKTRPFMVFSGDIYTTALGTEFTVTAIPKERYILVRLMEGKVVVKSAKNHKNKRMKDTFLTPGQELVYEIASGDAMVRYFVNEPDKTNNTGDNPAVPVSVNKPWFMFNNQSLKSIFTDLEKMYDVKISYSKEEINKMYFIGKFEKSDSVEFILKQIAAINNLEVTRENNVFTIKKQVPKLKK